MTCWEQALNFLHVHILKLALLVHKEDVKKNLNSILIGTEGYEEDNVAKINFLYCNLNFYFIFSLSVVH